MYGSTVPPQPSVNTGMDMVKQMMMMAAFQGGANGRRVGVGGGQSQFSAILTMAYTSAVVGIIDFILARLPAIIAYVQAWYMERIQRVTSEITRALPVVVVENGVEVKKVRTSITFELKPSQSSSNSQNNNNRPNVNQADSDVLSIAILDLVTNFKEAQSVSYVGGQYILSGTEPIHLTSDVSAVLVKGATIDNDGGQTIEFFSYSLNMTEIRAYVAEIQEQYRMKVMNNLGTKLYYFNEIPVAATSHVGQDGKVIKSYHGIPPYFTYSMQEFVTNRRFTNLFGPEIDVIRKRVEFFVNNKKWYDKKGIPYTLGLLLSGPPGTGKTSIIKCLANETGRYIINVNMHGDITKSQMQNLFFNETLMVVRNGVSVNIHVPIAKRIYVLEDVDCQGNIVLDRKLKAKMREHISKVACMEDTSSVDSFDEGPYQLPVGSNVGPGSGLDEFPRRTQQEAGRAPMSRIDRLKMGATQGGANPMSANMGPMSVNPSSGGPPMGIRHDPWSSTVQNKIAAVSSMHTEQEGPELTMSFLLNLFDGILETPGRILVMTANEPEILDEALVRPGRMDVICKMDFCTNETICDIIEHFTDVPLTAEHREIIMQSTPGRVTPAEMNKLLFEHMGNVDQAMAAILDFIRNKKV